MITHLFQSTVFAFVAWLLVLSMRRNRARTRYAIWLTASLKFLVPFALLISAGAHLRWKVTPAIPHRAQAFVQQQAQSTVGSAIVPYLRVAPSQGESPKPVAPLLLTFWFAGFAFVLTRHFVEWGRVARLARNSRASPRRGPFTAVPVVTCSASLEPGVFGIFRPVLLLPENIEDKLTPAQLDALIAHELFHIDRRDNLTAALHMLVEAVFWFHPLVWWIGARLVEERERACDEAVVESGSERYAYAEGILNVCKFYVQSPSLCVAGVTGSNLRKRIEQIMSHQTARNLKAGKKVLLALAACCTIAFPLFVGMANAPGLLAQTPARFDTGLVAPHMTGGTTMVTRIRPGRISVESAPLKNLVSLAWLVKDIQVEGGPDWVASTTWDISGIATNRNATQDDTLAMLQSLLEDRFKMTVHRETKILPVYVLVPAPGGLKLPAAKASARSMEMMVRYLEGITHHVVIDQTGFQGTFDFPLKERLGELHHDLGSHSNPSGFAPLPPSLDVYPDLEEELGLRLEFRDAPVDMLVIDHAEKPTEIQ